MLRVELKEKFTSLHFEKVISKYWDLSHKEQNIQFDLSRLEWIAIEQITFLISWINQLANLNKTVSVQFASLKDVHTNELVFRRRQNCFNYLVNDWKIFALLDNRVKKLSGDINTTRVRKSAIPYQAVEILPYLATTFDTFFYELYGTTFGTFIKYIEKEIKENTLLSYFDNHFLHYSIIKELYSNTCQHAFTDSKGKKCFLSLASNNKIDKRYYGELLKSKLQERYEERPKEEQKFFRDEEDNYVNTSFIEFNFIDFGEGIVSTLRDKYLAEDKELLKDKLNPNHEKQNEHTRILEYAFLLFTSKYELGKDFEMHDYIPRGLYIIKDIVRRYGGMIIARSKKGKVIFNCKAQGLAQEVIFRDNDFDETIAEGFPGTSITLILPSKEKENVSHFNREVKLAHETYPNSHTINLLSYTNKLLSSKIVSGQPTEAEKRIKFFEEFFKNVCTELLQLKSPNGDLVLFDFAGIEKGSQDIFNKFIYFLAYCPLISDKIHVCLFNIIEKGINHALLTGEDEIKKSKGFFAKPIPCIYPNLSVSWIGIYDNELEKGITEVWKENYSKNSTYDDIHHLVGNILTILVVEHGRTTFAIKIQSFFNILELIYKHHKTFIENELTEKRIEFKELKNEEHNFNIVLNTKFDRKTGKQRAYLTSNGKYQIEFLTFIEKLYIREYRRLISTYFLFNFCYDNMGKDLREATKVLTVTLSSQLLGKEFTEIMNDLQFSKGIVSLIPLSNYYDFHTEEPFNEIHHNDNIIVVNDVISTGNLSQKIAQSVHDKKASITSMITIIDSRTDDDKKIEIKSRITSLFERPVKKFNDNPFDTNPIWINPILNAPTTMSREKSNKESILKNPKEFIELFKDDKIFKVGYFQQNTRHLSYYLQTDDFFRSEQKNGFPVISQIIEALKDRIASERFLLLETDLTEIRRMQRTFNHQYDSRKQSGPTAARKFSRITKSFSEIERLLSEQLAEKRQYSIYEDANHFIDFIFYPFLSSVSEIEKNLNPVSLSLRGNQSIEVFPLPRIMTPRGWRFSFPPKFLNFHTREKAALILDDGSCTGETIIQMIDSLSFLELNEIFVLSIFGRLEDFQREFLSRIKEVKVKDKHKVYKAIPVSIYFATHFHIPIYNKNTHPANSELNELHVIENLFAKNTSHLPKHLEYYIDRRKSEISHPINPHYSDKQYSIFPATVSKRQMFVLRDLVGNYDSYRLFKEDDINSDELNQSEQILWNLKELLKDNNAKRSLVAVLIHEPHLVNTIRRIYPEILSEEREKNGLKDFIKTELLSTDGIDEQYFFFYLVGLVVIDINSFVELALLSSLLKRIEDLSGDSDHILNYIGFIFSSILYKTMKDVNEETFYKAKMTLQTLYIHRKDYNLVNSKCSSLIKELYNETLPGVVDFPESKNLSQIIRVKEYYLRQLSNHDGQDDSSHPNSYVAISKLTNKLGRFQRVEPTIDEKAEFQKELYEMFIGINKRLFNDLIPVLEFLQQFFLNYDLGIDIPEYSSSIQKMKSIERMIKEGRFGNEILVGNNVSAFRKWLLDFQRGFFLLSSELPRFFINDRVSLFPLVTNIIAEHESKKGKLNIVVYIPIDVVLEIHPYLFNLIIYELIENKSKYAKDSEAKIIFAQTENELKIIYWQNAPFKDDRNENGLITIRNIVKRYIGKTSIRTDGSYYEFEISFNNDIKVKGNG